MFSKDILSIDIGNKHIKIVQGKMVDNNIIINKKAIIKTPLYSFSDGEFLEYEKVKNEILNLIIINRFKGKKVVCTVDSTKIITREIILPFSNEKDLNSLISFEIEEYLPIILEDFVVEYKVLDELLEEGIKKVKILVAAIPKEIARNYYKLIEDLNLRPIALDLTSNAISKMIKFNNEYEFENYSFKKTVAIIDLGYSFTNVSVISDNIMKINKLIPLGSKQIDLNIANSFNLNLEEAEIKKINNGSLNTKREDDYTIQMIIEAIKSATDNQLIEIEKVFQYYTTRLLGNKIDSILLYGGGSNLDGILDYFKYYFNIPTYKLEFLENIKMNNKFEDLELDYFLNSISAIIRG